jgi:starch phosphorylase
VLRDFAELWPERFNNKTNGVTPRRWLYLCNHDLAQAITTRIGDGWVTDLSRLIELEDYVADPSFAKEVRGTKRANKERLAAILHQRFGVELDPDMIFDVQVKRIHEYKRQLMNCLHVVDLYRRIKFEGQEIVPRAVLFGGKAAPGYAMAKKQIKLINDVAAMVNTDPDTRDQLRCFFVPNYNVSMAQRIIPAADLSEQISMAGKEASGTGNMKFQMNGALTIGTLDGANIEIRQEVGEENFFLFGLDAEEVREVQARGYEPDRHIAASPNLRGAIELVENGYFSPDDPSLHRDVVSYLRYDDPYLICADFEDYVACQERAAEVYADQERWTQMAITNIARSGKFSSDRTITEYAQQIWNVTPVPIELEPYVPPA